MALVRARELLLMTRRTSRQTPEDNKSKAAQTVGSALKKFRDRSAHGSGVFTDSDIEKGYRLMPVMGNNMAGDRRSIAGFKEGLKRTESFGNPAYQRSRPDLDEDYDAMFAQVAEEPVREETEAGRGYIPAYEGKTRKNADHGEQSFFSTMQSRRPKP